jgi:prophage regulatory protein
MTAKRVMRRVAGLGWQVETPWTPGLELVRDDGTVLYQGPLVGTAEAASVVGVRPQNFVRDWASRPDFPAPVATLSSGRVWREADVRAYAISRRRSGPDRARLSEIARRVAWWDEPERTLSRPEIFVARVLGRGTIDDIADIGAKYGRAVMRRAVRQAPASLLGDKARNYWEVVLGMSHEPAPPAREVGG